MFVDVNSSNLSFIMNCKKFEFCSLKDSKLMINMGHAIGNDSDFIVDDNDGSIIENIWESIKETGNFAPLYDPESNKLKAILNTDLIVYCKLSIDEQNRDILDVWYDNYGFRVIKDDAEQLYQALLSTINA